MRLFPKRNKAPLGIYIHIPFCRSKCAYCDFYSLPCTQVSEDLMSEAASDPAEWTRCSSTPSETSSSPTTESPS